MEGEEGIEGIAGIEDGGLRIEGGGGRFEAEGAKVERESWNGAAERSSVSGAWSERTEERQMRG